MSLARKNFLDRLAILRTSLVEPAVSDGAPAEIQKNAVAGMLRSGLAVLAFAITEDFIKDRTAEVLKGFINTEINFGDLSESLQQAVTVSALKGILFRSELQDKSNKISWILGELEPVSNAALNISNLSRYSFGQARSNLTDKDPTDILSAFGVHGGWTAVSNIAKRIGLGGVLDYAQGFKDLAKRRHKAAHDTTAQIPLNDLNDSANTILGICCSFDILLSHALSNHNTGNIPNKNNGFISALNISFRFISPHPSLLGKYREQIEAHTNTTRHTVKVHATLEDANRDSATKAKTQKEQLVFLGRNGFPEHWETW